MKDLRSFWEGLTATDARIVGAAALLFLSLIGAAEIGLRRFAFCGIPEGKFLIWTHDVWSALAHRLGKSPETSDNDLILVGSSSLYHAFYGARGLQRTLHEKGSDRGVQLFHTPRQSLGDVLQIVENLPRGRAMLVLATTSGRTQGNAGAMAGELATSHLLLRSPSLARYLESRGISGWRARFLLPAAVNYLRLYLSLNRRHVTQGHWPPRWTLFTDRDQQQWWPYLSLPPEPAAAIAPPPPLKPPSLVHHHLALRTEHADELELLHDIVRAARERGYHPVLLESPLNPSWRRVYPEMPAWLHATHAALAEQEGIPYLDFFWGLGVPEEDFMDSVHLKVGCPGRLRFHHALADALVRLNAPAGALASRRGE